MYQGNTASVAHGNQRNGRLSAWWPQARIASSVVQAYSALRLRTRASGSGSNSTSSISKPT